MAHYAELDDDNVVKRVIVVNDSDEQDANGNDDEALGVAFCQSLFGAGTHWKRTSYHGKIRKRFAGIGMIYDAEADEFVARPMKKPDRKRGSKQ